MKTKCTRMIFAACTAAVLLFAGAATADRQGDKSEVFNTSSTDEMALRMLPVEPSDARPVGRVTAINGQAVSAPVQAQGGVAGGGQCAGLCGGAFPDECEGEACECFCDETCFFFGDCCADICTDCDTHVGCSQAIDFAYSNFVNFTGFGILHGDIILADDMFTPSGGGPLLLMQFTTAYLGGPAESFLETFDVEFSFWEIPEDQDGTFGPPTGDPLAVVTAEFEFVPPGMGPGFFVIATLGIEAGAVDLPQNVWIGMRFTDATFAGGGALENLGQVRYHPATFGTSTDRVWTEATGISPLSGTVSSWSLGYNLIGGVDYIGACLIGEAAAPCPADLSSQAASGVPDGTVDIFDLLFVLANWGTCADPNNCPADVSSQAASGSPDGTVDIFDLLFVLANWGACPPGGGGAECVLRTAGECAAENGQFSAELVGCGWPGVFDDPAGACCFPSGMCTSPVSATPLTADECVKAGGSFAGAYTFCFDTECPIDAAWSCAGECAAGASPNGMCFCDMACVGEGDCCLDACDECGACVPPDSCIGQCGSDIETPGGCFCDAACFGFGDCCPDICDVCEEEFEAQCPPPPHLSCAGGKCGLTMQDIIDFEIDLNQACSCDEDCEKNGDCCVDACAVCDEFLDFCPALDSCGDTGSCGAQAPSGCWCDEACCGFGDCCEDKFVECGGCDPAGDFAIVPCPPSGIQNPDTCVVGEHGHSGCSPIGGAPATEVFQPIACGETICSTAWKTSDGTTITRNVDWYVFELTADTVVQVCVQAEHATSLILTAPSGASPCPTGPAIATLGTTAAAPIVAGELGCITETLAAGTYYAVVLPHFTAGPSFDCTEHNKYNLSLSCFGAEFSCIDNCGGQTAGGCWCDNDCITNPAKECCLNVCDACELPSCSSCAAVALAGDCGEPDASSPDGSCFCDEDCCFFQDCCDDKFAECAGCDPETFVTCEDACGTYGPGGPTTCFCDASCFIFQDCCADVCDHCPAFAACD